MPPLFIETVLGEMMDRTTLKTNLQKLLIQRNIFLFFAVILSIGVVVLSCLLCVKKERIVIVPTAGSTFWVEDARVSDAYLEKVALYLSDLLLTRTPADVEKKNQIILEHVHPAFFHEAKKQLEQDKENIVAFNQTFLFRPGSSTIDSSKMAFILEGEMLAFIGKKGEAPSCSQVQRKKFTLGFRCERGKLLLASLQREDL